MKSSHPEAPIVLPIRSVRQLLADEHSPLAVSRIHPDVAEALWTAAEKKPKGAPLRVELDVPSGEERHAGEVREALRLHFLRECEAAREKLRDIYQDARKSAAIGLSIALVLLVASELLFKSGSGHLSEAVARGLIILSWVALWHPADLFLYAHFPVRRRRAIARALSEADVTLRAG